MLNNKKQMGIRFPREMADAIAIKAYEEGFSVNEIIVSAVGSYLTRDVEHLDLWLSKTQKVNDELKRIEINIKGITQMFLYFVQTFFFLHPEISDGYDESIAFEEAKRMTTEWLKLLAGKRSSNLDFFEDFKKIILEDEEKSKKEAQKK